MYDDETYDSGLRDDATDHDNYHYGSDTTKVSRPKPAPVDTTRLKKDLERDEAWPMDFFAGTGETWKHMKGSVARSDSLKNARQGKIPAK